MLGSAPRGTRRREHRQKGPAAVPLTLTGAVITGLVLAALILALAAGCRRLERYIVRRGHGLTREDLSSGRVLLVRDPHTGLLLPVLREDVYRRITFVPPSRNGNRAA